MQSLTEVQADPGKGLIGDRYFGDTGTFSPHPPNRILNSR